MKPPPIMTMSALWLPLSGAFICWCSGVLVAAEEEVYRQAAQEARSIISSAVLQNVQSLGETSRVGQNRDRQTAAQQGCCVRCGRVITWNPEAPFCRPCFSVWAQYEDPDYEEQFCHSCGRPSPTSMSKPECYSCYSR